MLSQTWQQEACREVCVPFCPPALSIPWRREGERTWWQAPALGHLFLSQWPYKEQLTLGSFWGYWMYCSTHTVHEGCIWVHLDKRTPSHVQHTVVTGTTGGSAQTTQHLVLKSWIWFIVICNPAWRHPARHCTGQLWAWRWISSKWLESWISAFYLKLITTKDETVAARITSQSCKIQSVSLTNLINHCCVLVSDEL